MNRKRADVRDIKLRQQATVCKLKDMGCLIQKYKLFFFFAMIDQSELSISVILKASNTDTQSDYQF